MKKRKLQLDKEVLLSTQTPLLDGGTNNLPCVIAHLVVLSIELGTTFDDSVIVCTGDGGGGSPSVSCTPASCTCQGSDIPGGPTC